MRTLVAAALIGASCSYNVTFSDCQVACATSAGCPDGFTCGGEALCRASGATGTCAGIFDAGDGSNGGSAPSGIYVTDFRNNQILVFATDASGSAAPLRTISGADTMLNAPAGIAIDHAGEIVVANAGGTVTVYPGDADGNVAPSRVLAASGLMDPYSVAIGADDGVFVACPTPQVFHFPPGATTSDRSFNGAAISGEPFIALTEAGDVVVSDRGTVATFAESATGAATPIRSFSIGQSSIAPAIVVTGGAIALTEDTGQILLFDEQLDGTGTPTSTLEPPEIVHGVAAESIAVDASTGSPVFYVGAAQTHAVFVVPTTGSGASLTAGTVRTITQPTTVEPTGIAVVP